MTEDDPESNINKPRMIRYNPIQGISFYRRTRDRPNLTIESWNRSDTLINLEFVPEISAGSVVSFNDIRYEGGNRVAAGKHNLTIDSEWVPIWDNNTENETVDFGNRQNINLRPYRQINFEITAPTELSDEYVLSLIHI